MKEKCRQRRKPPRRPRRSEWFLIWCVAIPEGSSYDAELKRMCVEPTLKAHSTFFPDDWSADIADVPAYTVPIPPFIDGPSFVAHAFQ